MTIEATTTTNFSEMSPEAKRVALEHGLRIKGIDINNPGVQKFLESNFAETAQPGIIWTHNPLSETEEHTNQGFEIKVTENGFEVTPISETPISNQK